MPPPPSPSQPFHQPPHSGPRPPNLTPPLAISYLIIHLGVLLVVLIKVRTGVHEVTEGVTANEQSGQPFLCSPCSVSS